MRHPAGLIFAASLALAASPHGACAQSDADRQAIVRFYQAWSEAAAREGPDGYARYFAMDAVLLPPGAPPVTGRAAIRDWMAKTLASQPYVTRPGGVSQDDVRSSGDYAFARSTLRGDRVPKAGGAPTPFETKYLDVLHRTPDGGWEFVGRMWNSNLQENPGGRP